MKNQRGFTLWEVINLLVLVGLVVLVVYLFRHCNWFSF
jgi:Tfp pilus assembly protein PilE